MNRATNISAVKAERSSPLPGTVGAALRRDSGNTSGRKAPPTARQSGSVIILMLLTVFLAAFLLAKFVQRAGTEMLADARASDQARLRREAYSALEVTLAVLADFRATDGALRSPAQGWDDPLGYAGYEPAGGVKVAVDYEDESGKVSLPRADATGWSNLLLQLGLTRSEAERAADAILGWTQPDHLATGLETDAQNYQRGALPHRPALRPLRSFSELAAVQVAKDFFFDGTGRPTELLRELEASASLYSFDRVNINSAPAAVLAAAGLDGGQADALKTFARQQRKSGGPGFFNSVAEAAAIVGGNAPLQNFGADVSALRIKITVRDGAAAYRLEAVVAPPGGATFAPNPPPPADGEQKGATPGADQTPAAVSGGGTGVADSNRKKLDYPFKVLEIVEDAEAPSDPVQ
ncbi:MAG: general secretion pathway protein GspK [Opitutae bacterium]|nr:general secretion pathway protein GspK [Opitutae bacterium]